MEADADADDDTAEKAAADVDDDTAEKASEGAEA